MFYRAIKVLQTTLLVNIIFHSELLQTLLPHIAYKIKERALFFHYFNGISTRQQTVRLLRDFAFLAEQTDLRMCGEPYK